MRLPTLRAQVESACLVPEREAGNVVKDTAIHQNHGPGFDGREDAGQRHGGPHRDGQRAFRKDYGFAAHKIRSDAPKWSRQLIEVGDVGIPQCRSAC